MRKKNILGTVLLSMFAWQSYAHEGAQGQRQQQQQRGPSAKQYRTLQELKDTCWSFRNNRQIKAFLNSFDCLEEREFWVEVGTQRFPLINRSSISFKALIKDGKHQSEWVALPGHAPEAWGTCPVLKKYVATAHHSVTINSCDELDAIRSEDEHCSLALADTWNACEMEQSAAQVADGNMIFPMNSACQYTATNVTMSCTDGDVLPSKPQCQQQQQQAPCQGTAQQCQHQMAQCDVVLDEPCHLNEAGASVREVDFKKSKFHPHHRAVVITSVPVEGSWLARLGLTEGDIVEKINHDRIRTEKDFYKHLSKATVEGRIRVRYLPFDNKDGKLKEFEVAPF